MKNYVVLLLFGLLFWASCSKDSENLLDTSNPIVFDNMAVGQQSRYVLLKGEDYKNRDNHQFEYQRDTMIIEIVSQDENGFLAEEYLSAGSASLNGEYHVAFPELTFSYYFNVQDTLLTIQAIKEREISRVFFLFDTALPLVKSEYLKVTMPSWKTSLPYKESYIMAYLEPYLLFDKRYDYLNVMIDNEGMKQNLPGYTHVYSAEFGLVRSSQYSPETSKGFGWDLLAD